MVKKGKGAKSICRMDRLDYSFSVTCVYSSKICFSIFHFISVLE